MYQITITLHYQVILQDVVNKQRAQMWYSLIKNNNEAGWNINIVKLRIDPTFNLKDEFE